MARRRRRIHHRGRGLFSIGGKVLGKVFKIATRTGVKIAKKSKPASHEESQRY